MKKYLRNKRDGGTFHYNEHTACLLQTGEWELVDEKSEPVVEEKRVKTEETHHARGRK